MWWLSDAVETNGRKKQKSDSGATASSSSVRWVIWRWRRGSGSSSAEVLPAIIISYYRLRTMCFIDHQGAALHCTALSSLLCFTSTLHPPLLHFPPWISERWSPPSRLELTRSPCVGCRYVGSRATSCTPARGTTVSRSGMWRSVDVKTQISCSNIGNAVLCVTVKGEGVVSISLLVHRFNTIPLLLVPCAWWWCYHFSPWLRPTIRSITSSLLMPPPSHLSPSTPSRSSCPLHLIFPPPHPLTTIPYALLSSHLLSSAPRLCGDVCEFQGDDVTALFRSSAPRSHLTPRRKDQVSYLSYLW